MVNFVTLPRRIFASPWTLLLGRLVLGGLFLWAGVLKYFDLRGFAAIVSRYGLVPEELLLAVALSLPLLEIVAGAGVILGLRGSLPLMLGLLLLFIAVLWFGILRGLEIDCGCFSLGEQEEHGSLWAAFWRDWLMVGGVVYLWLMQRRTGSLRPA